MVVAEFRIMVLRKLSPGVFYCLYGLGILNDESGKERRSWGVGELCFRTLFL